MGYPLLTLFQKIKIVQAMHNVSDSYIRNCIGNSRYYNVEKGISDLPLETAMKFFELCDLSDTEKLWFLDKNASDYPIPQNLLNKINKIADVVEGQQQTQSLLSKDGFTQNGAGEKVGIKKPAKKSTETGFP